MNKTAISVGDLGLTKVTLTRTDVAVGEQGQTHASITQGPRMSMSVGHISNTLIVTSAVTGPRGPSGEGIENFDGDPLLIYRLYSGMHP